MEKKIQSKTSNTVILYYVLSVLFAQDGMFVPLFPNQNVLKQGDHHCSSVEIRIINCIDEHGMIFLLYMIYLFLS